MEQDPLALHELAANGKLHNCWQSYSQPFAGFESLLANPGRQVPEKTQTPAEQDGSALANLPVHETPQAPQFFASALTSTLSSTLPLQSLSFWSQISTP